MYRTSFKEKTGNRKVLNIAIIGCGGIGEKRLYTLGNNKLIYAVDIDIIRAERLCNLRGQGKAVTNWQDVISIPSVDLIIIATANNLLSEIAIAALENNKHVIVEKPAGRNLSELVKVCEAQKSSKSFAKVGFNHRFHPALQKAKILVESGELGELMFIRGRYGHGGRPGYEKEWRFNQEISGGGELLDQGVHLIDLSRWLFGEEFIDISGHVVNYYWNTTLEDNGFIQLLTNTKKMAWLHVSATEWKNMFSFEIYGKNGKLSIDGLGGSYGIERLAYYKMLPRMGPPETTIWEYPFPDNSWQLEFDYLMDCMERNILPEGNIFDAKKAMEIVNTLYENAR
jgi:predicted dehydrogenase